MPKYDKFVNELVKSGIDKIILEKLIEEYRTIKKEHLLGDNEKVILHAAKFSDIVLAFIKNNETKTIVDINNIHFNQLYEEILKYPKKTPEKVILTLAIPRVAISVYTIRSKKNVAHIKTINPSVVDSHYCVSACDWILSEIALLLYTSDPKEASELIDSLVTKRVPTVEEFEDQSVVILRKDLTLAQEILLFLYYRYPQRVLNSEIFKSFKSTNVYSILSRLENEKLIHRVKNGNKLTKLGIAFIESNILGK